MPKSSELASPIRVWIVDDDTIFRRQCALLLQIEDGILCDRQFDSAEDLTEALKQMAGPAVILLDLGLPGMSGIDAILQVKSLSPTTVVFIFSSYFAPHQEINARIHGAKGVFLKLDFEDLLAAIRAESLKG